MASRENTNSRVCVKVFLVARILHNTAFAPSTSPSMLRRAGSKMVTFVAQTEQKGARNVVLRRSFEPLADLYELEYPTKSYAQNRLRKHKAIQNRHKGDVLVSLFVTV